MAKTQKNKGPKCNGRMMAVGILSLLVLVVLVGVLTKKKESFNEITDEINISAPQITDPSQDQSVYYFSKIDIRKEFNIINHKNELLTANIKKNGSDPRCSKALPMVLTFNPLNPLCYNSSRSWKFEPDLNLVEVYKILPSNGNGTLTTLSPGSTLILNSIVNTGYKKFLVKRVEGEKYHIKDACNSGLFLNGSLTFQTTPYEWIIRPVKS